MAKYEVLFACGHTATIQLYGKHLECESYIQWCRENRVCPDCYEKEKAEEKAERLAEYKKEAEKAKTEAESLGLPQLEGSPKQVSWAMNIRKELLPLIEEAYNYLDKNFDSKKYKKEVCLNCAKEWLNRFQSQTKASFWIDHRDMDARDLALECARFVTKKMTEEKE